MGMMFVATTISSFCANVVANPMDVIKSRMQNMVVAADGSVPYTSMVDCFAKSIRNDGIFVVWRGFTPAFIKLAPYSSVCVHVVIVGFILDEFFWWTAIISLTLADKLTKAITGKEAL